MILSWRIYDNKTLKKFQVMTYRGLLLSGNIKHVSNGLQGKLDDMYSGFKTDQFEPDIPLGCKIMDELDEAVNNNSSCQNVIGDSRAFNIVKKLLVFWR